VGASGGILMLWDTSEVGVLAKFGQCYYNSRKFCEKNGGDFALVNVCAPCDAHGSQDLWVHLDIVLSNN